jgi:protein O-GlcNAc transferase
MNSDTDHALRTAMQHHQAGRLTAAESLYRQILSQHPNHPDALHLLGLIARQTGNIADSVTLIRKAISLNPNWPDAYYNLGASLKSNGQLDEAIAAYRQAAVLNPNLTAAFYSLGNALLEKGSLDQAIAAYRQAIKLKPDHAEAHGNMGVALQNSGKNAEAITAYHTAIALHPNYAEAYANLGVAYREKGEVNQAIDAFGRSISLNPNLPHTHFNLANALISIGKIDAGILSYRRAIALKPDYAGAYNNLGNTLIDIGQLDEAIAAYRQATMLEPNNSLFDSALICAMHYHPKCDGRAITSEHARWNRQHAEKFSRLIQPQSNDPTADRRLRIGYISRDFRNHPVGRFLLPLIESHHRDLFEICCYSDVAIPDQMTARFQSRANLWRETTSLKHDQVAEQIRSDKIDILVDLSGHTTGGRLLVFARRPAPVQVSYLGYPGTTGLPAIDYRLTDTLSDPPGQTDSLQAEKLFRLPHTNWCFSEPEHAPAVHPSPMIKNGYVTFGSFNTLVKVTDSMLKTWACIVNQVPRSRLLLKSAAFVSAIARDRVGRVLFSQGVDVDRITLLGPVPDHATHLAAYHQVDIALDTFPYHGTTTTCDALWMGVPVITLAGQTHVSRVGVSLLSSVGLSELIASTQDEYANIAVALAHHPHRLEDLRTNLRRQMKQSPLMDAAGFTREVEAAYRQMWRRWCDRSTSRAIDTEQTNPLRSSR